MTRCNPYGAENPGGYHDNPLGGMTGQRVVQQYYCPNDAVHRFVWVCEHGHKSSQPVPLCQQHYDEFTGSLDAPWNIRRDVRTCPACAAQAPTPQQQHKCKVRLVSVS